MRFIVLSGVLAGALLAWTSPASAQDGLRTEVFFGNGGVITGEGIAAATVDVGTTAWLAERWGLGAWGTLPLLGGTGGLLFTPALRYQHPLPRGRSLHFGVGPASSG